MLDVPLVDPTYESLPLFPLPKFAMMPNTMTQVHVFEPRYRMLVADVLAGQRLFVLVGYKMGVESEHYGAPPTFEIGSLCKVVNYERTRDGRYCLHVHCLARVRIQQINRLLPYRTAAVMVLPDMPVDSWALDEAMDGLMATLRSLVVKLGDKGAQLAQIIASTRKPILLTHRLGSALVSDPDDRQRLLENVNPLERIERINDIAGEALLRADCPDVSFAHFDGATVN
ncbi:MAG: hypothetical protein EXR77_19460 [Myxococcales bacterium]|nr:hypothetical protein [Myxococcales bacterium]